METNRKNNAPRDADGHPEHALTPMTVVRHSGKAACVGAVTGALVGAMAGAVAGVAAWSMWALGREAAKALRDRAHL